VRTDDPRLEGPPTAETAPEDETAQVGISPLRVVVVIAATIVGVVLFLLAFDYLRQRTANRIAVVVSRSSWASSASSSCSGR
jgi:hypothetical protein